MTSFSERMVSAIREKKNPVVVGLDPRMESLPNAFASEDSATAYRNFCRGVIDVVSELVPIVKPQSAFFEQLGPQGVHALADVVAYARQKGLLVILDGKRNDIGSTALAYAEAYLGNNANGISADALTVSPYLGDDSLQPFVQSSIENGNGIFVLVKTSNPGGGMLQDLVADGKKIYQHVAEYVQTLAAESVSETDYGAIGAVVGATYPAQLQELRAVMRNVWILVPGYGAQGGTANDVRHAFDATGLGAVVNSSRGIIFAHQRPEFASASNWQRAVELAAKQMIDELRSATPVGRL